MNKILLLALAALAFTSACKKDDESVPTMQLSGSLASSNEVPAVSVASSATGTVTGTYVPSTKVVNYVVTYSGLTGPVTGAHFHFGDAKHRTAIPTLPFPSGTGAPASGSFSGTATMTAPQADSLMAGRIYANLHTDKNPNGEIRANMTAK
jgi:hypothetical protein